MSHKMITSQDDHLMQGHWVQGLSQGGEPPGDPLDVLLRRDPFSFCALNILESVVIGPGLEPHVITALPAMTCQDISLD